MRVPEGFKQTEVGVIPKDWDASDLESISLVPMQNGLFYEPKRKGCGVHLVNVGDMYTTAPISIDTLDLFDATTLQIQTFRTQEGDLFFTRSSVVPSGIAYCNILPNLKGSDVVFDSHLIRVRANPNIMDARFLYLNCLAVHSRKYLVSSAKTSTMTTIDQGALKTCPILVPPLPEQRAIAAALSDMDALIEGVKKLLEKKRRIKQGAMQELLKPKEGWKIKKLGELCTLSKKRIDPKKNQQVYKCVELEHIGQESGRLLGYAFTDELKSQKTLFNSGDTLFGKLRPYLKKFLFTDFDGCCTTEIWALQSTSCIHRKLLFYIIQTDAVLEAANQSEGTKMPRADWKKVKEIKISIPPKQEQKKIAAILSDMDTEIEQLETQRTKYRQLKTGMMQELLTGKKRLV
jgi:type I restriction enzyme S subunit